MVRNFSSRLFSTVLLIAYGHGAETRKENLQLKGEEQTGQKVSSLIFLFIEVHYAALFLIPLGPAWKPVRFYPSVFSGRFRAFPGVKYTDLSSSVFLSDTFRPKSSTPSGALYFFPSNTHYGMKSLRLNGSIPRVSMMSFCVPIFVLMILG